MAKITQALEDILQGHQIKDFAMNWIENSNVNADELVENYNYLKKIGLTDCKIASQAQLLGSNPETIRRHYDNGLPFNELY